MKLKKEHHWRLSDSEFEQAFADGSLPIPWFTHGAHIRLAWIHLQEYGLDRAIENIRAQIQRFAKAAGAPDKYHETITVAAILMVDQFRKKHPAANSEAFVQQHPFLSKDFKALISKHYSTDIFTDTGARKEFLQPDLLPFD